MRQSGFQSDLTSPAYYCYKISLRNPVSLYFLFSLLPNAMLKLILTGIFIKYLELRPNKD